jgi:hypothetical protein
MATTYEMIKALPAKFDWTGFNTTLRAEYVALVGRNVEAYCVREALAGWDAAKGVRQMRGAAMEMACSIVSRKATRSFRSAPTAETLAFDSFEGGVCEVWTDAEAEAAATQEIAELIAERRAA